MIKLYNIASIFGFLWQVEETRDRDRPRTASHRPIRTLTIDLDDVSTFLSDTSQSTVPIDRKAPDSTGGVSLQLLSAKQVPLPEPVSTVHAGDGHFFVVSRCVVAHATELFSFSIHCKFNLWLEKLCRNR